MNGAGCLLCTIGVARHIQRSVADLPVKMSAGCSEKRWSRLERD
ncbi:hypothetical protein Mal65_30830 [Crateriforma conspicua]|nr:hypothetical protein Mal65_30830 [Crateriforma conspicua]